MLVYENSKSNEATSIKSDNSVAELSSNTQYFDSCKYLDKNVTKKFILNQNWELLKRWVAYNLKKKKPKKK